MPDPASLATAHDAIRAVFRVESAKLVSRLARMVRDVGVAEELSQDVLIAALERWPSDGVPDNPGAWLMAAGKRRALDVLRRGRLAHAKHEVLARDEQAREQTLPDLDAQLDDEIGDDLLRLIVIACHPLLPIEGRVALTLRLLGGLTTEEIARAFLVQESTIAQRIVRAKRMLAESSVPFEVPRGQELLQRLPAVLEVAYLIFNEGYSATSGDDWLRPALCEDALRLGRLLTEVAPEHAEVFGLLALMELQVSRSAARVDAAGGPILLLEQDRTRWDRTAIERGLWALSRAEALAGAGGAYALQAAIAACHARAQTPEQTDWPRIAVLYYALAERMPSPVVELNRAVAVGMAFGPTAGLAITDALVEEGALAGYHLLPAVRGDLLMKLERFAEAARELRRAFDLTRNQRERALLLDRIAQCEARLPAASD